MKGLMKGRQGKWVIIQTSNLYRNGSSLKGGHLFQYSILNVNPGCCTAVFKFNKQYIIDGGYQFHNYAITDDDEESDIPDYSLSHLEVDYVAYNKHLGHGNKIINDQEHTKCKVEEHVVVRDGTNVSDLKSKFDNKVDPFSPMLAEIEAQGDMMEYVISSGPNQGKSNFNQLWKNKHSDYRFF